MSTHFKDIFEAGNPAGAFTQVPSLLQRFTMDGETQDVIKRLERGDFSNPEEAFAKLINRAVLSTNTAFPVRENLEAEAKVVTPVETPLRNMLPRVPGSGRSAAWKLQSSFGVGLGTTTTTSGTTNATDTLTVVNARGFFAGETILYNSNTHTISSINYSTNVISVGASPGITSNSQTNGQAVVKNSAFFPEQGAAAQAFYAEDGTPVENTTVYADRSASYKLLGDKGGVTMFAMASGANFMDQYAKEKENTLFRTFLKEEFSLLHGESAATNAPWGDGTTALAYQGLLPFITANSPGANVQTSVGALTARHIDQQLSRVYNQGGRGMYIMASSFELESLSRIATASGNYRLVISGDLANASIGVKIGKFVHAASGEEVPIYRSQFMPVGTMLFGSLKNAIGQPNAEVSVLPQTSAPDSAFLDGIQGYYAQEIAPDNATPEVLRFKVSVYSVPMWKDATKFALSRGITAAA